MGANTSQISDLAGNQSLKTLVGTEAICENDPFWNQLISFTVVSPTSRYARVAGSIIKLPQMASFRNVGFRHRPGEIHSSGVGPARVAQHRLLVCGEPRLYDSAF